MIEFLPFSHFVVFVLFSLFFSVSAQAGLSNGDFENGTMGWNSWGGRAWSQHKQEGEGAAMIANAQAKWSGIHQEVVIADSARLLGLGGWIRTDTVVGGKKPWERARISIEFLDDQGERIGDYPPSLGDVEGTTPWQSFWREFAIPQNTKKIKVVCALGNATGTAYFDNLKMHLFTAQGQEIIDERDLPPAWKLKREAQKAKQNADSAKQENHINHLASAGFERPGVWNIGTMQMQSWNKRSGRFALYAHNNERLWTQAEQTLLIDSSVQEVVISGWMKTQGVQQGKEDFEQARISIEFLDAGGGLAFGYPPVLGEAIGTQDWTYYKKTYSVPHKAGKKAAMLKVLCALGNATGEAWWDDLRVELRNAQGEAVAPLDIPGIMDAGEWYALPVNPQARGGHFVDWSGLLDAPAGKHGFAQAAGDEIHFSDGTPVRFWGANLVGGHVFLEKPAVDSLVTRLAKMGANLLRLHHMDAPWAEPNLFGNHPTSTRQLDSTSLDKLDYLIYRLKEKGIYVYMDLLVHREFTPEDGVPEALPDRGGKQMGIFMPNLIALQKEFMRQLLTHKNPYTGLAYNEEPAIIGSEFINESTIFTHFSGTMIQGSYKDYLDSLWKAAGNQGEMTRYKHDWQANNRGILLAEKHPENHQATMRFMKNLEADYYDDMRRFMRDSLGIKYMLSGTNYPPQILAMLHNNTSQDAIISNDYWDHPQVWKINNDWGRSQWAPFHNASQLTNPQSSLMHTKGFGKVNQMPYMITEWKHCGWNEHILEGVPLMAAYASFQGWNGLMQFDTDEAALGEKIIRQLTLSHSPDDVMQWVIAAPLFLRQDVARNPGEVIEPISEADIFNEQSYTRFQEKYDYLPFVTRVKKQFYSDTISTSELTHLTTEAHLKAQKYAHFHDSINGIYRAQSDQLFWNYKQGQLAIITPRTQGFVGTQQSGDSIKTFSTKFMQANVKNTKASVLFTSADGKMLKNSERIYLVAAGPSKMSGVRYNKSRTALTLLGDLPILTQALQGDLSIQAEGQWRITWLASDGSAVQSETLSAKEGSLHIPLKGISPVMLLEKQ
jgi:hypothetical protein